MNEVPDVTDKPEKMMMAKKIRNDQRKAIAFDLLMTQGYISRTRAAKALRIARRLV